MPIPMEITVIVGFVFLGICLLTAIGVCLYKIFKPDHYDIHRRAAEDHVHLTKQFYKATGAIIRETTKQATPFRLMK